MYSSEDINLSCLRALPFGIYTYSIVKKILESNRYHLPLNESFGGGYAKCNLRSKRIEIMWYG